MQALHGSTDPKYYAKAILDLLDGMRLSFALKVLEAAKDSLAEHTVVTVLKPASDDIFSRGSKLGRS